MPFSSMSRLRTLQLGLIVAASVLPGATLLGACGMASEASTLALGATGGAESPDGTGGGATGDGVGGSQNIDYTVSDGGGAAGAAPSHLGCGTGCIPSTGTESSCTLGEGGGEGGGGGTATGSCKLIVNNEGVTGECTSDGASADGEPCLTATDCAAGFGCVESGTCRAYCCGDPEACPGGSYCAERPIVAKDVSSPIITVPSLPVCAPVEPCTLLDDTTCSTPGDACTIVRLDGTTSCVAPGAGLLDEACPCAAGFFCAADATCEKLCRTDRPGDCPPAFQCSGGSKQFPSGFGVCVKL